MKSFGDKVLHASIGKPEPRLSSTLLMLRLSFNNTILNIPDAMLTSRMKRVTTAPWSIAFSSVAEKQLRPVEGRKRKGNVGGSIRSVWCFQDSRMTGACLGKEINTCQVQDLHPARGCIATVATEKQRSLAQKVGVCLGSEQATIKRATNVRNWSDR